jgi:hypothetical protein
MNKSKLKWLPNINRFGHSKWTICCFGQVFDNAWARSEEEQKDGEKLMGDNYNLEAYWQEKM